MNGIQACVFDAYGTLFDYASAAAKCRDQLGIAADVTSLESLPEIVGV
jgi:2-haloacid dehalogenase